MDDEDCALGLMVKLLDEGTDNKKVEWKVSGDKRLLHKDNSTNYEKCLDALQRSRQEIWECYAGSNDTFMSDVLQKFIPTLKGAQGFSPLFRVKDRKLKRREPIGDRTATDFVEDTNFLDIYQKHKQAFPYG
ncbi:hypothetical protein RU639_009437 [Aspergillus parasiticus]